MKLKATLALSIAVILGSPSLAAASDISADIIRSRPLVESRRMPVIMKLEHKGGLPVLPDEYANIFVHVIDPKMGDYHLEKAKPMGNPGEFVFTITPYTACGYQVWAELSPAEGTPVFAKTKLEGAEKCTRTDETAELKEKDKIDDYVVKFETEDGELTAEAEETVVISVTDSKGRYIRELQPIMGSFGTLVAVGEGGQNLSVLEPLDEPPTSWTDIAGPKLRFKYLPPKEGNVKFFGRFNIEGKEVTADFVQKVAGPIAFLDNFEFLENVEPEQRVIQANPEPQREPEPQPVSAEPEKDEIDFLMEQETKAIREEEKAEQESTHVLDSLYQGGGGLGGAADLYENTEQEVLRSSGDESGQ